MQKIKKVIDKYFDFIDEIDGNSFIEDLIPELMLNTTKPAKYEGTRFWTAIDSTIGQKEIKELSAYFGHQLPNSYQFFLQYRHFIELQLGIDSFNFFKNLPNTLVEDTIEEIEDYYPGLIDKNYIPFARKSDHGVFCFDANGITQNANYSIVSFDQEDDLSSPKKHSTSFELLFVEFEAHLDDWINTKRNQNS